MFFAHDFYHFVKDTTDVNIDSDEFKKLPHEIQHEMIVEMHEKSKRHSRYQEIDMPEVYHSLLYITSVDKHMLCEETHVLSCKSHLTNLA